MQVGDPIPEMGLAHVPMRPPNVLHFPPNVSDILSATEPLGTSGVLVMQILAAWKSSLRGRPGRLLTLTHPYPLFPHDFFDT